MEIYDASKRSYSFLSAGRPSAGSYERVLAGGAWELSAGFLVPSLTVMRWSYWVVEPLATFQRCGPWASIGAMATSLQTRRLRWPPAVAAGGALQLRRRAPKGPLRRYQIRLALLTRTTLRGRARTAHVVRVVGMADQN